MDFLNPFLAAPRSSTHVVAPVGIDGVLREFVVVCVEQVALYSAHDKQPRRLQWQLSAWLPDDARESHLVGFRLTATAVAERCAVITEMFVDREEFRQRSLGEALIGVAAVCSGRRILSSVPSESLAWLHAEHRTLDADKVWRRLCAAKRARYIPRLGRYLYHPS